MPEIYDEEYELKYDKKIRNGISERQQRAARVKAERERERNKILAIIAAGTVVLVILIAVVAKALSGGSEEKEIKPVETTTPIETTTEEATTEEATTAPTVMRTTDVLNLRETASTDAKILRQIPEGKEVTVLSSDGTWCYVQYKKKKGYVKLEFLTD